MRRAYLFWGLASSMAAFVWSCGLDDTAVFSLDNNQDASSDGTTFDGTTNDSGGDTGVTDSGGGDSGGGDSGFDAGPCPVGDLPICDDDGGCSSANAVCTPPVGSGWTVVNLQSGAGGTCAGAYSNPKSLVAVVDGGPSACVCSCTSGAAPSCMNDLVELGSGGAACANSVQGIQMTDGCSGLSLSVGVATDYAATVTTSSACSGLTDASFPDPDGGLLSTCDLSSDAGVLCESHRSCVPKPASGKVCIASTTATSCPNGFTRLDVASSFSDTRSCPSCGCGWTNDGCDTPVVTLKGSGDCSGGGGTAVGSSCTSVTGVFGSIALTGAAPAQAPTCAVNDGGVLDGGVAITSPEIICCSN